MKTLSKKLAKQLFKNLPWGVREAFFESYVEKASSFKVLGKLATAHHIAHLFVEGDYGLIQGDPHDRAILEHYSTTGKWAERTNALIKEFFSHTDHGTYIDIGANIGLTTIPIAKNRNVTCFCFEPEPKNYEYLKQNIKYNCPSKNVNVFNYAIYDSEQVLEFEKSPNNNGDHRLRLNTSTCLIGENDWQAIKINAVPLDSIIPDISGPLVVKIDVQGAEPCVIKGGRETLSKASLIIMEFCPYMMSRMGCDLNTIIEFVRSYSKVCIALDEDKKSNPQMNGQDAATFLEQYYAENVGNPFWGYCDILCYKD